MQTEGLDASMNPFFLVEYFNKQVIGIDRPKVKTLSDAEWEWLIHALEEEIDELVNAHNIVDEVDALIDLIYFAIGGLTRLGLTAEQAELCFNVVHMANMAKKKGNKGRGSDLDAVKPVDWVSPESQIATILNVEIGK